MKKLLLLLITITLFSLQTLGAEVKKVYFFKQEGCSNCASMEEFLNSLKPVFPDMEIVAFQVDSDIDAALKYESVVEKFNIASASVPMVMIGEYFWTGARSAVKENIAFSLSKYQTREYVDYVGDIIYGGITDVSQIKPAYVDQISIPFIGDIRISSLSVIGATALIAFIDGFNPCSLWVLTLVLGMALRAGKRMQVFLIGFLFLVTTSLVYGGFLFGAVTVVNVLKFSNLLRWLLIGGIAFYSIVNIKDYFAFKKGVSFTIDDTQSKSFIKRLRKYMNPSRGFGALLIGTIVLALSAALIELPCTAGFPVLWAQMLSDHGLIESGFFSYLGLYLLIYLLDEVVILIVVVVTLKRQFIDNKKGQILKLISGGLMTSLVMHLIFLQDLMHTSWGILSVAAVTLILCLILAGIKKKSLLPIST